MVNDLQDGETAEMQGSGAKPYLLKNIGGIYSCSCPAWRNQSTPIERRTCKHLRKFRGEDAEQDRIGSELPAPVKSKAKKDAPPLLLAQSWDNLTPLDGWWMSEKLDGVRAYWDGTRFLSRLGNLYHAPDWFIQSLPKEPLDGELWMDRQKFQKTVSIVRRQDKSDHWKEIKFVVFDAPAHEGTFEERQKHLETLVNATKSDQIEALPQEICKNTAHLTEELARIEALGGEGLMLRQPGSKYQAGRSWTLLKVKTFHDAEAVVMDHVKGKGKHKGRMGALNVELPDGTTFSIGTGFSDKQRETPPAIGAVVMFRYQELSDGGVPRFPSFVRVADPEKTEAVLASVKKKTGPAKKTAAKKKAPTPPSSMGEDVARFELNDEKSSKFWEVSLNGTEVIVRYGRIGTAGTTKAKTLENEAAAQMHHDKLIAQKTGKGYVPASE